MDSSLSRLPFLDRLAGHIAELKEPVLIVMPNKRSQAILNQSLKEIGHQNFEIQTADQLMEELSGLALIEPEEALLTFYSSYLEIESTPQPFEEFSSWGSTFLSDVNDVDLYLGNIDEIYHQIAEYQSIDLDERGPLENEFRSFWSRMPGYYAGLKEKLHSIKLGYRGMIYREVANLCESNEAILSKTFMERKTLWVGIVPGNPSETKLLDWIKINSDLQVFLDVDQYYIGSSVHEAGRLFRQSPYLESGNWKVNLLGTKNLKVNVHPIAGYSGQVLRANQILSEMPKEELSNTVLILTDKKLLKPTLRLLEIDELDINVTMSQSLKDTGIHQFVMALLSMHSTAISRESDVAFHQKQIQTVLTSPVIKKWIDGTAAWAKIEKQILKRNWKYVRLDWLRSELEADMFTEQCFHLLFDWESQFSFIANRLVSILNDWKDNVSKVELDSIDKAAIEPYIAKLTQLFSQYNQVFTNEDLKKLRTFLHRHIGYGRFFIQGSRGEGIQLMNMLETRMIDFKNVILLGASDDNFPGNPMQPTLIPFVHRIHHKLPTSKDTLSLISYHFYRLLQRAESVHLVYNRSAENLNSGEASRYVLQLKHDLSISNPNCELAFHEETLEMNAKDQQPLEVYKSPELIEQVKRGIEAKLSPSAINTYINSPLEFYFYYVLRVPEPSVVEEDMEASTFGSVVHDVLQSLYEPFRGNYIDLAVLKSHLDGADNLVEQRFKKDFDASEISSGKNLIQVELAKSYVRRFIQLDLAEMKEFGPVKILALEDRLEEWMPLNGMNIRLFGFADRIDERDGIVRIVDYKTGKVEPGELKCNFDQMFADAKYSKALQLAFYKWAYARRHGMPTDSIESSIFSFKRQKNGFMNLNILEDDSNFNPEFEEGLSAVINEMLDETIPFAHKQESKYISF
jgi:hypothetical protein